MEDIMFSFEQFSYGGVEDKLSFTEKGFESTKKINFGKQHLLHGAEDQQQSVGNNSLCSDYGFYGDGSLQEDFLFSKHQEELQQQQQSISDYDLLDDLRFDALSPPFQTNIEEIAKFGKFPTVIPDVEAKKEKENPFSLAALKLLKSYGSGLKRLNPERIMEPNKDAAASIEIKNQGLSTEEIIRIAGARFIQYTSQAGDVSSMLSHPFELSFLGLSHEEIRDVELVELLLASAEKVGSQQFERASKLLNQCESLSSNTANPVQRLVYYFSEALRERIDRETGRFTMKGLGKQKAFDIDEAMMTLNPTNLAFLRGIPFCQLAQFSATQAILENVSQAKKIHIIDLGIKNGIQWTVLMQALASREECHLELLKISAIGTTCKHLIEDTGKRLLSFAQSLNLPFSFKTVMVTDMVHLKEDLFELNADETVAVYSEYTLRCMIPQPNTLESLMKMIRNIKPCVMVVAEVEGNLNSPAFVNRFTEAFFFFGAYFDCLEAFLKRDDPNRMIAESLYFGQAISNIVATEGEERKTRHVKIDVWRAFFARFGLQEAEFSTASLYQAKLLLKKSSCGSSCTLDMNGKCLLVGWKGTPLQSVSVWKFLT